MSIKLTEVTMGTVLVVQKFMHRENRPHGHLKRFDELKNFYNLLMNEQDEYEKT